MSEYTISAAATGLPIFQSVPDHYFTFTATNDKSDPHIRENDVAVIDPADCTPVAGALFLIEYETCRGPLLEIVEPYKSSHRFTASPEEFAWFVCACNRPRNWAQTQEWMRQGRRIATGEGPYTDVSLEAKLRGRVVGLLEPAGIEPVEVPGSPADFDERDWIKAFENAGYILRVHEGGLFLDLSNDPTVIPKPVSVQALDWQRTKPGWQNWVMATLSLQEKPFVAADYLALERSIGHEVRACIHKGELWIGVEYLYSKRPTKAEEDTYVAGMWRCRAWEKQNPDWALQIKAALDAEQVAGGRSNG